MPGSRDCVCVREKDRDRDRETEIRALERVHANVSCQQLCPVYCQHLAELESQLLLSLPEVAPSASTEPIHLPVV